MTVHPLRTPRLRMGRSCLGAVLPLCLPRRREWPFYALCIPYISHFITWYPNDLQNPVLCGFLCPPTISSCIGQVFAWTLCSHSWAYTVISIWQEAKFETHSAQSLLLPVSLLFLCVEIGKQTILNWLVAKILHIPSSLNFCVIVILCFTVIPKYWSFAIFSLSLLAICINVYLQCPICIRSVHFVLYEASPLWTFRITARDHMRQSNLSEISLPYKTREM